MQYNFGVSKVQSCSNAVLNENYVEGIQDIFVQVAKSQDIGLISSLIEKKVLNQTEEVIASYKKLVEQIEKDVGSYRYQQTLLEKLQFLMTYGVVSCIPRKNGTCICATIKDDLHEYNCVIDTKKEFIKFDSTDIKGGAWLNDIVVISFTSTHPKADYEIKRTKITGRRYESQGKSLCSESVKISRKCYNNANEEVFSRLISEETTCGIVANEEKTVTSVPLELHRTTDSYFPHTLDSSILIERCKEEYVDYTDTTRNVQKRHEYLCRNNSPSSIALVPNSQKIEIDKRQRKKILSGKIDVKSFVETMENEITFGALKEIDASKQMLSKRFREALDKLK